MMDVKQEATHWVNSLFIPLVKWKIKKIEMQEGLVQGLAGDIMAVPAVYKWVTNLEYKQGGFLHKPTGRHP